MRFLFIMLAAIPLAGFGLLKPPADIEKIVDIESCALQESAAYTGANACKACHFSQWNTWKKTAMAKAFDTLKPGNKAERKKEFNLDPQKDYTKDPSCLPCHTTGYGLPGGYPKFDPGNQWSEEEKKRAVAMEGVQCESCHGPGSLTAPYKKENEAYKKEEVLKRGMIEPDETNCKSCHNSKSPTVEEGAAFNYEELKKDPEKIHKHTPLKHPH